MKGKSRGGGGWEVWRWNSGEVEGEVLRESREIMGDNES